jgi:hypothetical protein
MLRRMGPRVREDDDAITLPLNPSFALITARDHGRGARQYLVNRSGAMMAASSRMIVSESGIACSGSR